MKLAGSDVLACIGCHRRLESVAGKVQVHLDSLTDSKRCGHDLAESVYGSLNESQTERYYDKLQRYRETYDCSLAYKMRIPLVVLKVESEYRILNSHVEVCCHERQRLRYDSRDGGSSDTPLEDFNEQQVEADVGEGRDKQEVQRRGTVSDCA